LSISNETQCIKCNSLVTESIELQIEQLGKIKLGHHKINGWICDDCFGSSTLRENSPAIRDSNHQKQETTRAAKPLDVSPNTPKPDEAGLQM
jgi:hypothetical protein